VKVDRDERPDVDARYQAAVSAISGQGGWPLTAFLTPDGRPYFGGHVYSSRRPLRAARDLAGAADHGAGVARAARRGAGDRGERDGGHRAERELLRPRRRADAGAGGQDCRIGAEASSIRATAASVRSPSFLIRRRSTCCWSGHEPRQRAGTRCFYTTLEKMARGGVYDQLAGGFHRYSVDERWVVPHFEKMLYDNTELLRNYVHGFQSFVREDFLETAREIVAGSTRR
jgi:uncharacterized protein YyaL (SSP411 family)